jgi:hypothetical protein
MKKLGLLILAMAVMIAPALADTVTLSSGARYHGHFRGREMNGRVSFTDSQGAQYQFPIGDVQSITFNQAEDTVTLRNGRSYVGQLTGPAANEIAFIDDQGITYRFPVGEVSSVFFSPGWRGPYASGGEGIVLPAGSEISVRTDVVIDSQNAHPGQTFPATIATDVMAPDGRVVIRRHSPATLLLRNESAGGIHSATSFSICNRWSLTALTTGSCPPM